METKSREVSGPTSASHELGGVTPQRQLPAVLPPTNLPVTPSIFPSPSSQSHVQILDSTSRSAVTAVPASVSVSLQEPSPRIRAAAVHMVFANRMSSDFISPAAVENLQAWAGNAIFEALCNDVAVPESVRIIFNRVVD